MGGASVQAATKGVLAVLNVPARAARRSLAVNDPHNLKPFSRASSKYSSTTRFTSRGGIVCRSNTSVISISTGSGKGFQLKSHTASCVI
jgi:hypothetical protein